jgi:hypothetical protein
MNTKLGANEGLEKILLEWFQQMHSENVAISRPTLSQKATDIAHHLKQTILKPQMGGSIGIWNEQWSLIFCLKFT